MSLFKKVVEIGRVCLINNGPDKGRLCVIIDVVDQMLKDNIV
jgi:large subunit ribosomal protein L14e